MNYITAVYEDGVFRPTVPVELPEGTAALVQIATESLNIRALAPPGTEAAQIRIYECLAQSYETGDAQAAARHNEHQP
jgi:predicted DNA-binding antitoxin AbrB/MazE fold protein